MTHRGHVSAAARIQTYQTAVRACATTTTTATTATMIIQIGHGGAYGRERVAAGEEGRARQRQRNVR